MNYLFSDDATETKISGIGRRWRNFVSWHNLGYSTENTVHLYDINKPNLFDTTWVYSKGNFTTRVINPNLQDLINAGEIDFVYPTFSASHPFTATQQYYSDTWHTESGFASSDVTWRMPVPFTRVTGSDSITLAPNESFANFKSYRFFAEFLSYYTSYFGNPTATSANYNILKQNGKYEGGNPATPNDETGNWNQYIEIWNEPTAWWTKPNNFGYFKPEYLANFTHAAIGNVNGLITNIDTIQDVKVGIHATDPNMKIISPGLHEMDITYFLDYMSKLRNSTLRGSNFSFDVNSFHHYSAYSVYDMIQHLGSNFSVDALLTKSMEENNKSVDYDFTYPTGSNPDEIRTVTLESAPSTDNAYWICPELDGYKQRGIKMQNALSTAGIGGDLWVTEWGYSTLKSGAAKYPSTYAGQVLEAQARWLMRGFLEYDASPFTSSYWHWFKDGDGPFWDRHTGIIDNMGVRKTSWYYLHAMIEEIGDKKLLNSNLTAIGCTPDFVPSVHFVGNEMIPNNPTISCPRIYRYGTKEECEGDNDFADYNESVWAIWLPYMLGEDLEQDEYEINTMTFTMAELGLSSTDAPQQFYFNTPTDGTIHGVNSSIDDVIENNLSGEKYITVPVTEKPIFLHMRGERTCGNTEQDSNDCPLTPIYTLVDRTCTELVISVELSGTCYGRVDESSIIASIGNSNATPFNIINFINASVDPFEQNRFEITMSDLSPGTSYTFTYGANYTYDDGSGNDISGYIGGETVSFSTDNNIDDCFEGVVVMPLCDSIKTNSGFNGTLPVSIKFGNLSPTDLSTLQLSGCLYELQSSTNPTRISPCDPIAPVPYLDWELLSDTLETRVMLEYLSENTTYEVEFYLVNSGETIELGPFSCTFTTDGSDFDSETGADKITQLTITNTDNCLYNICFDPVKDASNAYVWKYRLEFRDQSFNSFPLYQDFTAEAPSQICFYNVDISTLQDPEFLVQVVAIPSTEGELNGNSSRFELQTCCSDINPTIYRINRTRCCSRYAFIDFFLGETTGRCPDDIDMNITATATNGYEVFNIHQYNNGLIRVIFYHDQIQNCVNLDFTLSIDLPNGNTKTLSGTIGSTNHACCQETCLPVPNPPVQSLQINPDLVSFTSGNELRLEYGLNNYIQQIKQSEQNGYPVHYVIIDKINEQVLKQKPYGGSVDFKLPLNSLNTTNLNDSYNAFVLIGKTFYNIVLPSLPQTLQQSSASQEQQLNSNKKVVETDKQDFSNRLNVYPNPANNLVAIVLNEGSIKKVKLFNAIGKIVFKQSYSDRTVSISLNNQTEGIYLLEVITNTGEKLTHKLIIEH